MPGSKPNCHHYLFNLGGIRPGELVLNASHPGDPTACVENAAPAPPTKGLELYKVATGLCIFRRHKQFYYLFDLYEGNGVCNPFLESKYELPFCTV